MTPALPAELVEAAGEYARCALDVERARLGTDADAFTRAFDKLMQADGAILDHAHCIAEDEQAADRAARGGG